MFSTGSKDFSPLLAAVMTMAMIYAVGIISGLIYNRLMVSVTQGVLKTIRDDMFAHMQTLPIKYFDTHTHGDVMSHYTNDTDTLRQMFSQSLTMVISSSITVITTAIAMLRLSLWLSLFVAVFLVLMLNVSKLIAGNSARFFIKQQQSLGELNGYIEEMMNGQKVIKVFCHEQEAKEGFDEKNEELRNSAYHANKFANILMPIMMNLGNLEYICIAILGGLLAINGIGGLTLGAIASFLSLSKSLTNPISQVSQQVNSVVMALPEPSVFSSLWTRLPSQTTEMLHLFTLRKAKTEYLRNHLQGHIYGLGKYLPMTDIIMWNLRETFVSTTLISDMRKARPSSIMYRFSLNPVRR